MKFTIKNISACLMASCAITSCNLDTVPTDTLKADGGNVFQTLDNADQVMRGIWNYAFNNGNSQAAVGIGSIMLADDFGGSDAVRGTSYGYSPAYRLTNGYSRGLYNNLLWDIAYTCIDNANAILDNIDNITTDDEETRSRIKGQAYATRGYMYMMLASHYSFAIDKDPDAVCVPVYTTASDLTTAETGVPASSVSEVYARALEDLRSATEYIPENYSHSGNATDIYKPDYLTACGLYARTALYARDWQTAYDYASKVLENNSYLMTEDEYMEGFSNCTNKEWIWGLSPTISDNAASQYLFTFKDCTTNDNWYTNLYADPYFKEMFEPGDYRSDLFFWGIASGQGGNYNGYSFINKKFVFKDFDNMLADLVMMRTSEMYLIKAEAAAHLTGKEDEARQTLYTLRSHRMKEGFTAAAVTAEGDELLKEIWIERRKELWGEGFALTDIIRNQQAVERKTYNHYALHDGKGVLVLDANGDPTFIDDESEEYKEAHGIQLIGHSTLTLPDESAFVPNSKYYLYRITQTEELQNKNLYDNYPMLDFYR